MKDNDGFSVIYTMPKGLFPPRYSQAVYQHK